MKNIAQVLVEHDVVRVNFDQKFKWTSGIESPIYADCRELTGSVEAREAVVDGFLQLIADNKLDPEVIAGTATAGIAWAAWVADRLKTPMLYVRSKPKGHGANKMVEGKCPNQQKILVVEDAFSTGGSSAKTAEALRNELEATVTTVLGIFSWETGLLQKNAESYGVNFLPLTTFSEITEALLEAGKITDDQKNELNEFRKSLV